MTSESAAIDRTTFRQIDVNKYVVTFTHTDQHTPDLITWELKDRKENERFVSFAETKNLEGVGGNTIELEIHLKEMFSDVPQLIQNAAEQSASGWEKLESAFDNALAESE